MTARLFPRFPNVAAHRAAVAAATHGAVADDARLLDVEIAVPAADADGHRAQSAACHASEHTTVSHNE